MAIIAAHFAVVLAVIYGIYRFGARKASTIKAELVKIEKEDIADAKAVIARIRAIL